MSPELDLRQQTLDNSGMTTTDPVPYGYCHCRCGGRTPIATRNRRESGNVKGQPIMFINGHYTKIQWADPAYRASHVAALAVWWTDPAERERQSVAAKARWQDSDYRVSRAAASQIQWADPAAREQRSVVTKAQFADPAARAKQSENHKRLGLRVSPDSHYSGKPTEAETRLAAALLADWLLHHWIGKHEVDLVLPSVRLCVEVDGNSHRKTAQKARDRRKEEFLLSRGQRVIRVSNEEVQTNLDGVVAFITAVAARPAAEHVARPW
jgi:very-short-patch-repair endonuclease